MERGTLKVRAWAIQASATTGWFPWHGLAVSGEAATKGAYHGRPVQRSAHHSIVHPAAGNSRAGHRGDRLWIAPARRQVAGRGRGEGSDQECCAASTATQTCPDRQRQRRRHHYTAAPARGRCCRAAVLEPQGLQRVDASQLRSIPSTHYTLLVCAYERRRPIAGRMQGLYALPADRPGLDGTRLDPPLRTCPITTSLFRGNCSPERPMRSVTAHPSFLSPSGAGMTGVQ